MESNSGGDQALRPLIFDVIKEFKAGGHFDRLRKDCFSEIVSQVSKLKYLFFKKILNSFVLKFLLLIRG